MMMGMLLVFASRRKSLQTSNPSNSGNIKSNKIKSGEDERALRKASAPSAAVKVWNPAWPRLYVTRSTTSGSSSTTRIFAFMRVR